MRELRTWREYLIEQLAADWEDAIDYLQVIVEGYQEGGDTPLFMLGLRTFVESQGGIAEVAQRAGIASESLSKVLSSDEPPRIDTLVTILNAFGWQLSIEPLKGKEPDLEISSREEVDLNTAGEEIPEQVTETPLP
ncbi:hypothetical protein C6500_17555 [Candidatus Poribacteria bacterium]|nr:MAG: hypothetical protein C6500_17555 [Candidatus Poribacteria bacterium]